MAADSNAPAFVRAARPGAIGSLSAFWALIEPVLLALEPRALCEVGVESGAFATRLLAWCRAHGCRYFGIDPVGIDDPDFLRKVEVSGGRFIKGRSLETLPTSEACSVYFLDGDHNFFTVRGELTAIAGRAHELTSGPVIFVHDVAWPWGRRDMYYATETIPAEYRQSFSTDLGVTPGNDGLVDGGLRAPGLYAIATHAGGERNGVLTAVETFLAEASAQPAASAQGGWELFMLPVAFGLAVLYRPETVPMECRRQLETLRAMAQRTGPFFRTLESSYLELYLFSEDISTAYRRLQAHAAEVQDHSAGIQKSYHEIQNSYHEIQKSYRELEAAYASLLAHSDSLLKEYHALDAYRRNLETANAQLLASRAVPQPPDA